MQSTYSLRLLKKDDGLLVTSDGAGADKRLTMVNNSLDESLLHQVSNGTASERATDLEAVGHNRGGDELVRGNLLLELLVCANVHQNSVVELITDLALAPLLRGIVNGVWTFSRKRKNYTPSSWPCRLPLLPCRP
jgi:hypothetical protein